MSGRLLILGSGALAREIALAMPLLVARHGDGLTLVVAARNSGRASWIARSVRARSRAADVPLDVLSCELDWNSVDQLAATVSSAAPGVILNTASLQSAWSLQTSQDGWSRLVREAGYGVTVALQAALLPRLGLALRSAGSESVVVNACYPDIVNSGGRRMGLEIRCGIGNIALVAEMLGQHLETREDDELKMLAGHWDVSELSRPAHERSDPPLVWRNGRAVEPEIIRGAPALTVDVTLNAFGAGNSAALLYALATNRPWTGHLPGPLGELGGYPVRLENGQLRVDLPGNITRDEARRWNWERCERDGAIVEEGHVRFGARAEELLHAVAPRLAGGFDFKDVESVAQAFVELRDGLGKHG